MSRSLGMLIIVKYISIFLHNVALASLRVRLLPRRRRGRETTIVDFCCCRRDIAGDMTARRRAHGRHLISHAYTVAAVTIDICLQTFSSANTFDGRRRSASRIDADGVDTLAGLRCCSSGRPSRHTILRVRDGHALPC